MRAFAAWLRNWQQARISNCERFALTSQTASGFLRTLLCHALLTEDLLEGGYEFVLTSKFQSDPIEGRLAQYQQMSGGRFLVGLKDVTSSEKIIKIKSLLKEEIDIDNSVKDTVDNEENIEHFINCSTDKVALSEDSEEVSCHIAGHFAKKLKKQYGSCCNQFLIASPITSESLEYPYIEIFVERRAYCSVSKLSELCVNCLCDSRFFLWSYI